MMLHLPDPATLYDALLARDASYEGRVWVGVSSTGIFCRLTCTARKPKAENCRWFDTPFAALEAGFRPCLRCRPLHELPGAEPCVSELISALDAEPGRRWEETDVRRAGYDPSTVRRAFKRALGMTFLDYARLKRLRAGFETLKAGGAVIDAQLDAGFESPSAFRAAFARLIGAAPGALAREALLKADWFETPLGGMIAVADARAIYLLEFVGRRALVTELKALRKAANGALGLGRTALHDRLQQALDAYFAGAPLPGDLPLAPLGTPFQKRVWAALREIPPGATRSYAELAETIGQPSATRAVARANGANPCALLIPCHRVIGADGSLTGYGGGLWRKEALLRLEAGLALT